MTSISEDLVCWSTRSEVRARTTYISFGVKSGYHSNVAICVGSSAREFVYRIKATNKGKYVVPPAFAESMYDRTVRARTLSGTMIVEEKKEEPKQHEKGK